VTLSRPVAYQRIAGQTQPVPVAYVLNGNRYGFQLGAHDPHHSVIIDPLVQATYLGGSGGDIAYTLAVGGGGQVYVAGKTQSTDFPGTTKGVQPACGDSGCKNGDAFVAELNAGLTTLTQATYLGGSGSDAVYTLAVGSGGQVYVAGGTDSTDFPKTTGGAQATNGGGPADAFVAELNAGLTTLTQATYLGGSGGDQAHILAVGSKGQVYVAGKTGSTDFPGTTGGAQSVCNDSSGICDLGDAFVAELNAGLTTLTQATYLGGSGIDQANALAVGGSGQVYVAGETQSADLLGTTGGAQAKTGGGTEDVFVARYDCLTSAACPTPPATPPVPPPAPGGSGGGGALGPWALLLFGGFGAAALRRRTQG
jgi:hypothetical protein